MEAKHLQNILNNPRSPSYSECLFRLFSYLFVWVYVWLYIFCSAFFVSFELAFEPSM